MAACREFRDGGLVGRPVVRRAAGRAPAPPLPEGPSGRESAIGNPTGGTDSRGAEPIRNESTGVCWRAFPRPASRRQRGQGLTEPVAQGLLSAESSLLSPPGRQCRTECALHLRLNRLFPQRAPEDAGHQDASQHAHQAGNMRLIVEYVREIPQVTMLLMHEKPGIKCTCDQSNQK